MQKGKPLKMDKTIEEKFLEFYDTLAPKIYRHAFFRVSSKELAEDIASQAFLKTWQYLIEAKTPIRNMRAFIYRVVNNLIIDHWRHKEKEAIPFDAEELKKIAKTQGAASTSHEENMQILCEALNKIDPEQKRFLIWRYVDDLSIKEISKISNKSKSNVYVIIHRGLKSLKIYVNQKNQKSS